MRSPGEAARPARAWLELVLRVVVIGVLAWYLAHVLLARSGGAAERTTSASLRASLVRWSTVARPPRVHLSLDAPPVGADRDWLSALQGTATEVSWSGPSLLPTAIAEEPRADPARGADVSVSAPAGAMVRIADTLGVVDSARATDAGVHAYIPRPRANVDAVVGSVVARAARGDSLDLKRLLVIGAASWETKFTVAALEERGWQVDALMSVSPKGDVRQGVIADIDTSRYSAVIAIDSTASRYGDRIARFVRMGGGALLWSPAARGRALAEIAPGAIGRLIEDPGTPPSDSAPRAALELLPITSLVPSAVVLERRGDAVSIAARRVGRGRVIENGYTTTWRWRMAGGDDAPEQHREWLAGLVAGVAYAGRIERAAAPTDVAPLASLVEHLGVPSAAWPGTAEDPASIARWVFAVLCIALLLEWGSRRLRGVK